MEILFASGAVAFGIGLAVVLLVLLFVLKAFIYIGRPNEVLVFSGRKQKMADGSDSGVREIRGEWAFQTPYFESMVGRMDLRDHPGQHQRAGRLLAGRHRAQRARRREREGLFAAGRAEERDRALPRARSRRRSAASRRRRSRATCAACSRR